MKKTLLKVATSAAAFTMLLASPVQMTVLAQDEDIIATVGDQQVTKEDFYQEMKSFYGNASTPIRLLFALLIKIALLKDMASLLMSR